jgi:hypothetical protein
VPILREITRVLQIDMQDAPLDGPSQHTLL